MDLKPVFLPKSPPPAHKTMAQEMTNSPSKDNHESPLDLSCRPIPGDGPLDLTLENKEKPSIPATIPTTVPVPVPKLPASPDDDVIVVDVKRGRGNPASLHNSPSSNRTVYNMCQKETYTGGVAISQSELFTGLHKLKQMMRLAKDPQQARQMAQTFQKKALQMLLKSRIQQQQRQHGSNESGATSTSLLSMPSTSRPFVPRSAPSAALGRPLDSTPPSSLAENYARVSEASTLGLGATSSNATSVHVIEPVLVVTSINSLSRMNSNVQVTSGSLHSSAQSQNERAIHPAFSQRNVATAVTMASLSGSYTSVTMAGSSLATTVTSPSVGTSTFRNHPLPKVSSAGNFESEYMKYVRSKKFMSGGSNITEEGKGPTSRRDIVKLESNASAAKKMVRPDMTEYQLLVSKITKFTKQALQMADARERRRDGNPTPIKISDMSSPPPAHSKITVSVNHKMPHRNPHLLQYPHLRTGHSRGHLVGQKYMPHMGYVSKAPQSKPNIQIPTIILPPQKVEPSATVTTPTANRPVVSNVKTWTPPVGQRSYVKQIINEENMKDVKELIKIPHFKFSERKSPVKNDKEEFQRIYSTGEAMDSGLANENFTSNTTGDSKPFVPESKPSATDQTSKEHTGINIPNSGLVTVSNIDVHSKDTGRPALGLSYEKNSNKDTTSLIIPPPMTKVMTPVTNRMESMDIPLPSNITINSNSPVNMNIPKVIEDTDSSVVTASSIQPRKTVVKPVTSTFIGWNVSSYKRIPVANVNPMKVKEGVQPQSDGISSNATSSSINQTTGSYSPVCPSVGNTYNPVSDFTPAIPKTSAGQPCLILPKPHIPNPNQTFVSTASAFVPIGQLLDKKDEMQSVSEDKKVSVVSQEELTKPKKRKKAKETDGKPKQPKEKSSKPKIKKLKVKAENTQLYDGGSSSVVAKTEAIKAILRDDFKNKISDFDAQPTSSQASSPVLKKTKSVITKKGVCFHSEEEESDGKKGSVDEVKDGVADGKVNGPPEKVRKRRKRSKILVKQKGHSIKKKLKASNSAPAEEASCFNQDVENKQEVCPTIGDCGGNPTRTLVMKISRKRKKRKSKVAKYDTNRERGSQLITYNKNAKYEQELLREEERRLVLKARRNARKSVRSDSSLQSEAGCHGDGFKYMDEDSWQQGAAESCGNHGNSGMTCGSAGIQDDIQYEVDSQAAGQQRMHTGVKLKRIVRTAMVEDQIEAGIFADEEDSGFPRRRLKRRRRRRWYKKRKSFVYVPVNYQFCMEEVDDTQYEGQYLPIEAPDTEALPYPDSSLQDACIDPELLSELKGVITCRETGETKLHRLTRMGHQDLAIRCIEAKLFSANARDHAGYTPLHESCVTGRLRVAKSLLQNGADVNIAAQDGTRPLHDAVDHNRLELVRLLLSHGADPHIATYSGKTPLKIARTPDMQRLIKGHLQDVGGVEHGENMDIWSFTPPWEDRAMEHLGCSVLTDPPSDSSSGEEEMEFELWDSTPLACQYFELDKELGPRNYYFLHDLSSLKGIPEEDFKLLNFDLNYKAATKDSISAQFNSSDQMQFDETLFKTSKKVDFVEATSSLKSLLEIDRCVINRAELTDGMLNDIFSETPTERLLLEGIVPNDAQIIPSNLAGTAYCSRKLDFSQSEASSRLMSLPEKCKENIGLCNHSDSIQNRHQVQVTGKNVECSETKLDKSQEMMCSKVIGPGGDDGVGHTAGKDTKRQPRSGYTEACADGDGVEKVHSIAKEDGHEYGNGCSDNENVKVGSQNQETNEGIPPGDVFERDADAIVKTQNKASRAMENNGDDDHSEIGQIPKIAEKEGASVSLKSSPENISGEKKDKLSQQEAQDTETYSERISSSETVCVPSTSSSGSDKNLPKSDDEILSKSKADTTLGNSHQKHVSTDEALPVLENELNEAEKVQEKRNSGDAELRDEDGKSNKDEDKAEEMPCLTPCL